MTGTENILIELIGNVLCDKPTSFDELSDEELAEVYALAKRHDISHFIGAAVSKKKIRVSQTAFRDYQNLMFATAVRMQQISFEFSDVCQKLEQAELEFIPLKGSVIKSYYPEPWMRTSCDIDILVHEEDLEKAIAALNVKGKYQVSERHYHDVSLMAAGRINIELHFNILESKDNLDAVLKDVWEYAKPQKGHKYLMELTPEFFLFHIYAHAAYHFLEGGCGVRPLMDIFLLENRLKYDGEKLETLLEKAKIKLFSRELTHLSEIWFANETHNDVTLSMERFIFSGGVYGTRKNKLMVRSTGTRSDNYIFNRIFMPYDVIKSIYPVLCKHKYLTPVFEVVRWFNLIFKGSYKKGINEMKVFNTVTDCDKQQVNLLLKKIGLRED